MKKPPKPPTRAKGPEGHPPQAAPPRQSSFDYHPGQVLIGKYQLLRVLGQGGMAQVWEAQNLVLDMRYAIKIHAANEDAHSAERMLREAQAVSHVDHPNIIKVFDYGITQRGDPFLVLELLNGPTIKEIVSQRGRLPPVEAVWLLLPILDALTAAHTAGVVHRDVKPDNIVCVTDAFGRVHPKIVDFGIAIRFEEGNDRITEVGMVLGSPEYMSPERAQGREFDHRTDIWSISVVLFEMLTGRTPFLRDDNLATLHAVVDGAAPSLADFGVFDPELDAIIARGLSKYPPGRWRDMHSLGKVLASWLERQGVHEDAAGQSLRAGWLSGGGSVAPVAMDTERERNRALAVDDDYEPPKSGVAQTSAGVVGAILLTSAIVLGGVYTAGLFTDVSDTATLGPTEETDTVVAARNVDVPLVSMPVTHAREAPDAGAEDAAAGAESDAMAAEDEPERVSGLESQATEPDRAARPKPRPRARFRAAPLPPPPEAPKGAGTSTELPQPKPPPDFGEPPSASGDSDNPYANGEDKPKEEKPEPPSDSKWGF